MKKKTTSSSAKKLLENILEATYEFIRGKHYVPLTKQSLIKRLQIQEHHLDIFDQVLKKLRTEEKIVCTENKYLSVPTLHSYEKPVTGTIHVHPRGFGFVQVDEGVDIFIPKAHLNDAIDNDIVSIAVDTQNVSEKGPEGRVLKIIERKKKSIVGTIISFKETTPIAFCPTLIGRTSAEVKVPTEWKEKISYGDQFLFSVINWGSSKEQAKVAPIECIGNIKDPSKDIEMAIRAYDLATVFPKKTIEEAQQFGKKVTKTDLQDRRDLQELHTLTIDPDTAKDYDDALSIERVGKKFQLYVHIADVSHYVKSGSELDTEAYKRSNSTYFPGRCLPMLPEELSNELCSLKEGVTRLTVTVQFTIQNDGAIEKTDIYKSAIKSSKRLTYKQAKAIIDSPSENEHKPVLLDMLELTQLLKNKRRERGSIEFSMPEVIVKVDDAGMPTGTEVIEYDITHQIVEEFMLLANEAVAKKLSSQGKELTFRVHEEPAKENMREFAAFVSALGFSISQDPEPMEIQKLFKEISESGNPLMEHLASSYIRSMRLACYSSDNIGHYGLSLEHYCHFTSPIRRYVDLIAHRLLFDTTLSKEEIHAICQHASGQERLSAKAEGDVVFLKKLRYLESLIANDRLRQFEAMVTKIKPFGIHFDVLGLMLDGFLHISELDDDYFVFSPQYNKLLGRHNNVDYSPGDSLLVRVNHMDIIARDISWELLAHSTKKDENTPSIL